MVMHTVFEGITIRREAGVARVVPTHVLYKALNAALEYEGSSGDVSLLLCSRAEIRRLNREFRDTDRVTDVLSFPDGQGGGDIALCASKVRAQARRFGHGKRREAAYLCVHSVLHLLGYDHVNDEAERAVMRAREEEIMGTLSFGKK